MKEAEAQGWTLRGGMLLLLLLLLSRFSHV